MSGTWIDVSGVRRVGDFQGFHHDGEEGFVVRLRFPENVVPAGAVQTSTDREWLLAFSGRCTHMGCRLIGAYDGHTAAHSMGQEGVIRCRCHLTCFDLAAEGRVVIGPAISRLPQLALEWAAEGQVRGLHWMGTGSDPVRRDVRFGMTDVE